MTESRHDAYRSGDPLFSFGPDLRVVSWNRALERLTGVPAADAVGQTCWQVLAGLDTRGSVICHAGCSNARLACQGWPVAAQELSIKTSNGRRFVLVSTIVTDNGDGPLILHLLRDGIDSSEEEPDEVEAEEPPALTTRQLEVLRLIGQGVPAKVVSSRLGLAEATVRNHIRAILLELGCHSQLEAVARARRLGLLD